MIFDLIFNFSIHLSFFYYYLHRSCALTLCLSYHYNYLSIVFNFLEKSYTHWLICKKQMKKKKRNERNEDQLNVVFFKFVIEHSICWLHHKATSINVINNENRDEANEMKINSTLCFSNLSLSIRFVDYIIKLHR